MAKLHLVRKKTRLTFLMFPLQIGSLQIREKPEENGNFLSHNQCEMQWSEKRQCKIYFECKYDSFIMLKARPQT